MGDKLNRATQESLLALVCFDDTPGGGRLVRALVPERYWDTYFREIYKEAVEYLDKWGRVPGEHLLDIVDGLAVRSPDKKVQYGDCFNALSDLRGKVNKDFILAKAKLFCRRQNQKAIVQRIAPLLSREDDGAVDEIDAILAGATKITQDISHPGILLNDPEQALSFMNKEVSDQIPTGILELDRIGVCPTRKKYMLIVAETSVGKSWAAVHLGRVASQYGFPVLHVSLEMSEDEVSQRYVQALYSIGQRDAEVSTTRFRKDSLGRVIELDPSVMKRPTLRDEGMYKKLLKKMKPMARKPRTYIRNFPSGTLTISRFKSYLDQLEAVQGFSPAIILFDYPDLCEHDPKNKRNELEKITVDLRGIAGERNIAMVGFSQVNEKKEGNVIKTGRTSEGRGKEHAADIVLSLNQTEAEYELGLMRLYVAKNRGEVKHTRVLISQALRVGQFCVDSALMSESSYWSLVKNGEAEKE